MKDDKRKNAYTPIFSSMLLLTVSVIALRYTYGKTLYAPFLMITVILLLPFLLSLELYLFQKDPIPKEKPQRPRKAPVSDGEEPSEVEAVPHGAKRAERGGVRRWLSFFAAFAVYWLTVFYKKSRSVLRVLAALATAVISSVFFIKAARGAVGSVVMLFRYPILLAVIFVLFVILEKWLKHTESEDSFAAALLRNMRSTLALGRLLLVLGVAFTAIHALGFAELTRIFTWILIGAFAYEVAFLLFSFAVRLVRRELSTAPSISVPIPFFFKGEDDLDLISYLEESTGITMRNLWSIKLIKNILPYAVIATALCLWLSTGLVQIEAYQEGALYRFGVLKEEPLGAGLHFVFPSPIDKVEIYDTENVSTMTIGYRAEGEGDNIWTSSHGKDEYKLLLGNGNELVSINLRLEYKISDLGAYVRAASDPEKILEALAYELVTDRTISTDLDTLLSADRVAFAETYREELSERVGTYSLGIEVVSVVLESIHPPVEIAETYQYMVSAEILAGQYLLDAEGRAAAMKANAEIERAVTVGQAQSAYYEKIAAANASVAEFMAAVEANNAYPDVYQYHKYLDALKQAYGGARIVLVGDGVDTKNLYFGSMVIQPN